MSKRVPGVPKYPGLAWTEVRTKRERHRVWVLTQVAIQLLSLCVAPHPMHAWRQRHHKLSCTTKACNAANNNPIAHTRRVHTKQALRHPQDLHPDVYTNRVQSLAQKHPARIGFLTASSIASMRGIPLKSFPHTLTWRARTVEGMRLEALERGHSRVCLANEYTLNCRPSRRALSLTTDRPQPRLSPLFLRFDSGHIRLRPGTPQFWHATFFLPSTCDRKEDLLRHLQRVQRDHVYPSHHTLARRPSSEQ